MIWPCLLGLVGLDTTTFANTSLQHDLGPKAAVWMSADTAHCQPQSPCTDATMSILPHAAELANGYHLEPGVPSISEYRNLRKAAGLTPVTEAQATRVAPGSWYGCYITYRNQDDDQPRAVAMGRIIGDGGWYFHIADMATLPEHQRRGLGGIVLKHLLAYIKENSPDDGQPYISLFADPPGVRLYEKNGFVACEHSNELGMIMAAKKED
ncbi:hypothetical protein diail_7913 [Diaporthe ilicicola]|nr:hypothetical protein diail_7913 [Diaporthe ilicicola]